MSFFDGTLEQSCKSLILNEYFNLTMELYPNFKNITLCAVYHNTSTYPMFLTHNVLMFHFTQNIVFQNT